MFLKSVFSQDMADFREYSGNRVFLCSGAHLSHPQLLGRQNLSLIPLKPINEVPSRLVVCRELCVRVAIEIKYRGKAMATTSTLAACSPQVLEDVQKSGAEREFQCQRVSISLVASMSQDWKDCRQRSGRMLTRPCTAVFLLLLVCSCERYWFALRNLWVTASCSV